MNVLCFECVSTCVVVRTANTTGPPGWHEHVYRIPKGMLVYWFKSNLGHLVSGVNSVQVYSNVQPVDARMEYWRLWQVQIEAANCILFLQAADQHHTCDVYQLLHKP